MTTKPYVGANQLFCVSLSWAFVCIILFAPVEPIGKHLRARTWKCYRIWQTICMGIITNKKRKKGKKKIIRALLLILLLFASIMSIFYFAFIAFADFKIYVLDNCLTAQHFLISFKQHSMLFFFIVRLFEFVLLHTILYQSLRLTTSICIPPTCYSILHANRSLKKLSLRERFLSAQNISSYNFSYGLYVVTDLFMCNWSVNCALFEYC